MSPNKSVHRSVAILNLAKIVAAIITFAQSILSAMTNNAQFPSPSPALSVLAGAVAGLQNAEAAAPARFASSTSPRRTALS